MIRLSSLSFIAKKGDDVNCQPLWPNKQYQSDQQPQGCSPVRDTTIEQK
jgi:hypothetical protein